MNRQEIYEAQREYFSRPGAVLAKTLATHGDHLSSQSCRYRLDPEDPTSPGCAVGCLIPNELYDEAMDNLGDGTSVDELLITYPSLFHNHILEGLRGDEFEEALEWLRATQKLHDVGAVNAKNFVAHLDKRAREIGLIVPE